MEYIIEILNALLEESLQLQMDTSTSNTRQWINLLTSDVSYLRQLDAKRKLNQYINMIIPMTQHNHNLNPYESNANGIKKRCKRLPNVHNHLSERALMTLQGIIHLQVMFRSGKLNHQCIMCEECYNLRSQLQFQNSARCCLHRP